MKVTGAILIILLAVLGQIGQGAEPSTTNSAKLSKANMDKMSQLLKAMIIYSMDQNETFPAALTDLNSGGVQYIVNTNTFLWTDPATGKKTAFLYRSGLTPSSSAEMMIIAAPRAFNGIRSFACVDGSVQTMNEEEFLKNAAGQKWVIPLSIKKENVAPELAAEIQAQITKLGDSDPKVRAAARAHLREIGPPATPFLEEQLKNPDPEIQTTARELLGR